MYAYAENAPTTYVDPQGFGKKKPTPALAPGLSQGRAVAIARGFQAALNRLKGGPCAKFFRCGAKDPNSAAARELGTIRFRHSCTRRRVR